MAYCSLFLPLVTVQLIRCTKIGLTEPETASLSMLGFLYASLPTAPTVFVYASMYQLASNQVCTVSYSNPTLKIYCCFEVAFSLFVCTFLSAPWLYFSCRMIAMRTMSKMVQHAYVDTVSIDSATVGLIGSVCVQIQYVQ